MPGGPSGQRPRRQAETQGPHQRRAHTDPRQDPGAQLEPSDGGSASGMPSYLSMRARSKLFAQHGLSNSHASAAEFIMLNLLQCSSPSNFSIGMLLSQYAFPGRNGSSNLSIAVSVQDMLTGPGHDAMPNSRYSKSLRVACCKQPPIATPIMHRVQYWLASIYTCALLCSMFRSTLFTCAWLLQVQLPVLLAA